MGSGKAFLAALLLAACTTEAHMFIKQPAPIPESAPKDPLDPSGSNFPCHGVSLPTSGGQTFAAGSQQPLSFELADGANTATHGGGSCQISITYETDPIKQKDPNNWKVIYSIEGGCPTDWNGNVPSAIPCKKGSNDTACVNDFSFSIPKGVKNGHGIMAWTWFNTIGNREMYMNCVNAQFTGGDGSEMDSFPSMFAANIESVDTCQSDESFNLKFPNPGKYVTTKTEGSPYPLAVPTGAGCQGPASYNNNNAGTSTSSPEAPSSSAPVAQTTMELSPPTIAPSAPVARPIPAPSQPSADPVPSSTAPPTYSSSSGASDSCIDNTVPCSTPGELICIDAQHFGICDLDKCAVPQPVAPGTSCKDGAIMKRRGLRSSRRFRHSF